MKKIPVRHLKDSFTEERFSIRSIEPLVSNGNLIHDLHRHDFFFVLFVQQGTGEHEIDFIKYPIDNYSVFFIRPGQVHQLELGKGTTGFMLQFTPDFYSPRENPANIVLRKASNRNHCHLTKDSFERIGLVFQIISQEFAQKQDRYKDVVTAGLDIIFIELVRQSGNQNKITNEARLYAQEKLEELQDLLEKHIHSQKQVSTYAEMLNITPYQLNAITKASLHKTCSELINEQIILEAKRMLIGTSNQVNQVADMLGYEDHSYFIRFFKKRTGHTPEAFRQNFK